MASNTEDVIIVHVPSLVVTLWAAEKAKGVPLTEQEVLDIRDRSPAIAMHPSHLLKIEEGRGYQDIDPEQCWSQWLVAREGLLENEKSQVRGPDAST